MVSIFNWMPGISASLFSVLYCMESQSVMNRSSVDLYMILTLYWCILSRMHCILCDNDATSFLKIATSGLWCVTIFSQSSSDGLSLVLCSITSASISVMLYLLSALDRLLLANAMGLSMLLLSALSLWQLVPLLVCSRAAPSVTPDVSVSRYSGWASS